MRVNLQGGGADRLGVEECMASEVSRITTRIPAMAPTCTMRLPTSNYIPSTKERGLEILLLALKPKF